MIISLPLNHPLKPYEEKTREKRLAMREHLESQGNGAIEAYRDSVLGGLLATAVGTFAPNSVALTFDGMFVPPPAPNGMGHEEFVQVLKKASSLSDEAARVCEVTGLTYREKAREVLRTYIHNWDEFNEIICTAWVEPDSASTLRYYRNTPVGVREMRISVAKFINQARHKFKFSAWTEEVAQQGAEWFSKAFAAPTYKFRIVDGYDIPETYHEEPFGSCMYGEGSVDFYASQSNVSLLRIEDEDGNLRGRALIWDAEEWAGDKKIDNVTVLDRIYPSDGGYHIDAAIKYARERGWLYKTSQSIGGGLSRDGEVVAGRRFCAHVEHTGDYPYLDTFCWSDGAGEILYTQAFGDVTYGWRSTDNSAPYSDDYGYMDRSDCY